MDSFIFLGFAVAYLALLTWGISSVARRRRAVVSDLSLLVVLGLVYDNTVIGLGAMIGEGAALEGLNSARYWMHAFLTPLLVLVAWHVLFRTGARWARNVWAAVVALGVTAALIAYEIVVGALPVQLAADWEYGALSYGNENAPSGPPIMVLVVAAALLAAGIVVWVRERWAWLTMVTVLMVAGSAITLPVPSAAVVNAFELILLVGVVATVAHQDRNAARHADEIREPR
ncbi:hypothetical protein [Microbacterium murale]|uniref:Phospholipid phosphatase n=1 Tax=Microbacterium murale TaxID=1081040 RepID=A0ABU0P8Y0_9MICO|nr:hypothetical protein [Microbacterium murale]MDQ0643806.1 hypothetical protein [Microbacterium murale]